MKLPSDEFRFIWNRCEIDEDFNCWIWLGCFRSKAPTMRHEGKVRPVRQIILDIKNVNSNGNYATYSCHNWKCVNPNHIELIDRKKLQQKIVDNMEVVVKMKRIKKMTITNQNKSNLDFNDIKDIRQSKLSLIELCIKYNKSEPAMRRILNGTSWKGIT